MRPIRFLGLSETLELQNMTIATHGGERGVRDMGLLHSALAMPRAGVGGEYFHQDLPAMAAAYLYHIVLNHPFVDGNKRAGLSVAAIFLRMNSLTICCTNDELTDMVLSVACGNLDKEGTATFLRRHCVPLEE